jgi:uncharacterized protein
MSIHITCEDIPIRVLASGAQLSFPVFRAEGEPGPKVYIQANIHGPEIAGIGAIYELLAILRQQETIHGSLTIVPSVNPVGLDSKINGLQVGYSDLNEHDYSNFNRIYQMLVADSAVNDPDSPCKVALDDFAQRYKDSDLATIKTAFRAALKVALNEIAAKRAPYGANHSQKLAMVIQTMAYNADYLIDLHTAGDAIYHLFTFAECLQVVPYFDLPYTIQLDESFSGVLDEAFLQPWLRLQRALEKEGRSIPFEDFQIEAFTVELGSADQIDREAMKTDAARLVNYLRLRGVLDGKAIKPAGEYYFAPHKFYRRYKAPTGGLLLWHKNAGDTVNAGETFVTILRVYASQPDGSGDTEIDIRAVEDGVIITRSESHVVHEGSSLCSVLTRLEQI